MTLTFRFEGAESRPDGIWVDVVLLDGATALGIFSVQVDAPVNNLRELLMREVVVSGGLATEDYPSSYMRADAYTFRPDGTFEHVRSEGRPALPARTVRAGRWVLDADSEARVTLDESPAQ